ncbi:chromobox protein 1-like protein [Leptotrombidium deliense]|uniref:Chromobox protein 1-like protein n=1 Tax=Leptotrombidium deliense TaxID=299467 RepID=A0A443S398_9ACAR|nr:chromobox protein 1-like protein [Leptotrombidium deliense]
MDKRRRGGKVEYLIKWQGWSHDDNTWEPEDHLNCPDIMKEFEEDLKAKKEKKMKREKERQREKERDRENDREKDRHRKEKHKSSSHEKSSKNSENKSDDKIKKLKLEDGTAKLLNVKKIIDSDDDDSKSDKSIDDDAEDDKVSEPDDGPVGFERGLEAKKIVGALMEGGIMKFLMKWKDCDAEDLVPASEANIKCPQVVINFYQKRLQWVTPPQN